VAEIMPTETVEAETLLELADQQLYRAKIAGRNCIRCTEAV
jgi:PleD family two-component response regulator